MPGGSAARSPARGFAGRSVTDARRAARSLALLAALAFGTGTAAAQVPGAASGGAPDPAARPAPDDVTIGAGAAEGGLGGAAARPAPSPFAAEPPVTGGIVTGTVSIAPLGPPGTGAGVLPSTVTGLPDDLWAESDAGVLAASIDGLPSDLPAAARALERVMMLAEADPPGAGDPEALLAARLAQLVRRGHLDAAAALAARAGPRTPALRRAAFDIALLLGDETEACRLADPDADAPEDYARRVFCLVRGGDFAAAATVMDNARALRRLDPEDEHLLELFLYPELLEDMAPPAPTLEPTPLQFRLHEALGEPIGTRDLPVAFARADLRPINGRKAQMEAAERLARVGAIEGTRLLQLYTDRLPSASGGVWDRAAAMRDVDAALRAANPKALALALPRAVAALEDAELLTAIADAIYPSVAALRPEGVEAETAALRLGLLSADYASAAAGWPEAEAPHLAMARAVALGAAPPAGGDALDEAVAAAFAEGAPVPDRLARPAREGRLGEALLLALDDLSAGGAGDRMRLAGALAFLRSAGFEDIARRVAIEILTDRAAA